MTLVTGVSNGARHGLKRYVALADRHAMIISDEQARLAAQDLRSHGAVCIGCRPDISDDLMALFVAAVEQAPNPRDDRVRSAIAVLDVGAHDSREVASKMISRIISDSLR